MEPYIKKSAIVAEIEKTEKYAKHRVNEAVDKYWQIHFDGWVTACRSIMSFLDALEVKEVDLEKELDEWMKYGPHTNYPWCTIPDAIRITAEHFYELGLKASYEENI